FATQQEVIVRPVVQAKRRLVKAAGKAKQRVGISGAEAGDQIALWIVEPFHAGAGGPAGIDLVKEVLVETVPARAAGTEGVEAQCVLLHAEAVMKHVRQTAVQIPSPDKAIHRAIRCRTNAGK